MIKNIFTVLGLLAGSFCSQKICSQTLHMMAYNIHHGCDTSEVLQLREIADLIRQSKAEIVGLEEVDSVCKRSGNTDQARILGQLTGMHFAYVRHFAFEGGSYGLALLSKYPVSDVINNRLPVSTKEDGDTRALLTATVHLPHGRKVVVAVAHLDYREEASRITQAKIIAGLFRNKKVPVFLLGDLNAGPDSETLRTLQELFSDTNPSGSLTYPAAYPREKIDFILLSKGDYQKTLSEPASQVYYSDHLPISSVVRFSGTRKG
jgi:endonuclease/exonuclease/phosphatase family metal-dependent hydrolase